MKCPSLALITGNDPERIRRNNDVLREFFSRAEQGGGLVTQQEANPTTANAPLSTQDAVLLSIMEI